MKPLHFWISISLSALVALFLLLQAIFTTQAQRAQAEVARAQETISQGQACETRWRQLATRIYQVGQQTQDQALKDLLTRQGINVRVATNAPSATAPAAPAPTAPETPAPTFH
jgi:hypothetical protein